MHAHETQRSILGPLLFIIYINDMSAVSRIFSFILYVDDTTLTMVFVFKNVCIIVFKCLGSNKIDSHSDLTSIY